MKIETALWGRYETETTECGYGEVVASCNADITQEMFDFCENKNICEVPITADKLQKTINVDVTECDAYAYLVYSFDCV